MGWDSIDNSITRATGKAFRAGARNPVGGGCINAAFALEGAGRRYFLKRNECALLHMFEAEAAGLRVLGGTQCLRVPEPLATGSDAEHSWIVLEYIPLVAPVPAAEEELGRQLAALHRNTAPAFGFYGDNYIGSTPQFNAWTERWTTFLSERRLGYQLELAASNGASISLIDRGHRLLEQLTTFFHSYSPQASLLHGDLWQGNAAMDDQGQPVIFDPACYYGDRESELAMCELFGGFSDRFYHSYRDSWDIDPGYTSRKVLYQLYHILNHFNLFGGSYGAQASQMIDTLLAET